LQFPGNVEIRAELILMARASSFDPMAGWIQAVGIDPHIELQPGVAGDQPPTVGEVPVRSDLYAVCFPAHEIGDSGLDGQVRLRDESKDRRSRLYGKSAP
jgi:hypothetical protein